MYLSEEFLSQYKHKKPPFGGNGLGEFVYLRTYSRWLPEKQRRETWQETCQRVVEYSMSLYQGPATYEDLASEAMALYDTLFHLRAFPAGRTLWIGGTKAAQDVPLANYNCSFVVIDDFEKFVELFYALMVGSGVGFRVLPEDVSNLPDVNTKAVLANKPYHGKIPDERIEDSMRFEEDGNVYIVVGDSKNGWIQSLRFYFDAITRKDVQAVMINYDSVRPYGEPLKTFGGRASGHQSLRDMFKFIHRTVTSGNKRLTPLQCLDIANTIGYYVVAGGVRRTSEIGLFDIHDDQVMNAKTGLFDPKHPNHGIHTRYMSNNSVYFKEKPTKEQLFGIIEGIKQSGEPGFVNAEAASKRRPYFKGVNPLCA